MVNILLPHLAVSYPIKAVMESVLSKHSVTDLMQGLITLINLAKIKAANNSRHGMDCIFTVVILAFEAINLI